MLGALLYLRLTSLRNLLRVRLLRLKQPKYLVGAIVGAAYFWFFFSGARFSRRPAARGCPITCRRNCSRCPRWSSPSRSSSSGSSA